MVARSAGFFRFSRSRPPAAYFGGMHDANEFPPAGYRYMLACTSCPAARAESIFAMAMGILGQFRGPLAFRWKISTGTPPSRPIRMASSMASRNLSPSERMWVMYTPPYGAMAFAASTSSSVLVYVLGG